MSVPPSIIQADFDRIARLADGRDHNSFYDDFLLSRVPSPCREALEVGCGAGAFSRRLGERSAHVLALDLSPQMIRIARERSAHHANIEFQVADVTRYGLPAEHFDCIAAIATLHHLPMAETLLKLRRALKPGGRLLILDLYQAATPADHLAGLAAFPVSLAWRLLRTGRLRAPREVRDAWAEHARHDVYPTLGEVRRTCANLLPGAEVRRRLLWRYTVVWPPNPPP
ncbi:MAG TPA: class I SAM-dependent methyltransferase [Blastocatellia bacterium]|nr:class I SAM-dependent methyltransferase [Blastocatellia bacterium]